MFMHELCLAAVHLRQSWVEPRRPRPLRSRPVFMRMQLACLDISPCPQPQLCHQYTGDTTVRCLARFRVRFRLRGFFQMEPSLMPLYHAVIPGNIGTDHVGLTVPNVQQAADFLIDVFGCKVRVSLISLFQ